MTKKKDTLRQQIYISIFSDIINGKYPVDFVFSEKFLMEKYQVSRAPVREALVQFTSNHILQSIPRQGYKIIQPKESLLFEIIKFRSELECSFLNTYHFYIKNSDILMLRKLCNDYNDSPEQDFLTRWKFNQIFHTSLFSLYGNEYAKQILTDALDRQIIFYAMKMKSHSYGVDFHIAMLDYLEQGNVKLASNLLRADIESLLSACSWLNS
ncbi:MAG: GntR family transcriptional regulator [Lachnospiraceae bacterium]|nr:GntR family transcriptional regulator [Lachnospiraceae bacterium]